MILAVLQARLSSSRLPNKVLLPILGKPMLLRQLERVSRARKIDKIVVATSTDPSDGELARLCAAESIDCYRGSLDDVLSRFYEAARRYEADHVVRLTGDCPLIDPEIITQTVELHLKGDFDYTNNNLPPTFPDGLDVEVMRMSQLAQVYQEARLVSEREHVTPFFYNHPERFRIGVLKNAEDLSALRWTVDEKSDYELVCRIYEALYPAAADFNYRDVLNWVRRHPEIARLNAGISRNEGYRKSLAKDAAHG